MNSVRPRGVTSARYRIQFLDRSANVVSEMYSFAFSAGYVIELLRAIDWPLVAVGGTATQ
jgi:hypothetical protein